MENEAGRGGEFVLKRRGTETDLTKDSEIGLRPFIFDIYLLTAWP